MQGVENRTEGTEFEASWDRIRTFDSPNPNVYLASLIERVKGVLDVVLVTPRYLCTVHLKLPLYCPYILVTGYKKIGTLAEKSNCYRKLLFLSTNYEIKQCTKKLKKKQLTWYGSVRRTDHEPCTTNRLYLIRKKRGERATNILEGWGQTIRYRRRRRPYESV